MIPIMHEFTIEYIRTKPDYKAAFSLALSVFSSQNSSIDYSDNKFLSDMKIHILDTKIFYLQNIRVFPRV